MRIRPLTRLIVMMALWVPLFAQQGGFIRGVVRDRSGGAVPGAEIRVQNEVTGARQKTYSDAHGAYVTSEISQSTYKLTVRADGFRTLTQLGIVVHENKIGIVDFVIDLLPLQQEVTVQSVSSDTTDPTATGLALNRESPQNALPANGRDLQSAVSIMPGATITPASLTNGGQFTVGGQRPNTNSFRVDGISGNAGIGVISLPGYLPGATLPGMTTIGSTQSLVSKEDIQRVDLRSADFAVDSGDRPGAQIAIETRAGTNDFHGGMFGYLRPHFLNSRDWFAKSVNDPLPTAFVDGWGGTVGGPVWRNHTFFFASMERMEVRDSALRLTPAPSAEALSQVGSQYAPILKAFLLPAGPRLSATELVGASTFEKDAQVSNYDVRLDQSLTGSVQFFGHFSKVPSSSTSIELGTAQSQFRWLSATGGLNIETPTVSQQLRANFSQVSSMSSHHDGAISDVPEVQAVSQLLNSYLGQQSNGLANYYSQITSLSIAGLGQILSGQSGVSTQRKWEAAYVLNKHMSHHEFRAGGDYLLLGPAGGVPDAIVSIVSPGIASLISGVPLGITFSSGTDIRAGLGRGSLFAQDTFRVNNRLTVIYGTRWELTPAQRLLSAGNAIYYPYIGTWNGVASIPSQLGGVIYSPGPKWPQKLTQFAPRLGFAYRLKSPEIIIRAGIGVFYDTALGSLVANLNPLNTWQYVPGAPLPQTAGPVATPSQEITLPRVIEWRTSIERAVSSKSLLSVSYLGSSGRNLLRKEASIDPTTGILQWLAFDSHGTSDYAAMLTQYAGNVTPSLYALVSYTWAHSIDTGSNDTSALLVRPGWNDRADRGSSSFDVRHLLSASASYRLNPPFARIILGGWNVSGTMQARTGFPFDVTTVDRSVGFGFENTGRPDFVPGQPIWLPDNLAPGGRVLNPAAFAPAANGLSGTLGRNVLTGNGLVQIDASIRKRFSLREKISMEASAAVFNVMNHPTFATPVSYLGSPLFGQSTSMGNLMLGSGSPGTGLTPVFQSGGPRTVELQIKITF
jgi:hypothetical protein